MGMNPDKSGGAYWSYIWIHGVRHGRSLRTRNKTEALRREVKFRSELDLRRHKHVEFDPDMPFSKLVADFLSGPCVRRYHICGSGMLPEPPCSPAMIVFSAKTDSLLL